LGDPQKTIIILIADDNKDDCLMAQEALSKIEIPHRLDRVSDGDMLLDYLYRRDEYEYLQNLPLPSLILLDLNIPKKSGLEVLREIKSDPNLRRIPIVILTTSETEEDIYASYDTGASSFINKSVTFASLMDIMEEIGKYWLEIVELPPDSLKRS